GRRPRGWLRTALRVLLVLLLAALALGGWMVYHGISTSVTAEKNLHATILAVIVVERFVEERGRWPRSWEELEGLKGTDHRNGYVWPKSAAEIRRRVAIDFDADPREVARQDPMTFTAIRPIGPYYEYRRYDFVPALQKALREAEKARA